MDLDSIKEKVLSGGIFGIGESWKDRIDMALILREFKPESVPVNMLNPVKGTAMGDRPVLTEDEVMRIICVYRFILPLLLSDLRQEETTLKTEEIFFLQTDATPPLQVTW